MSSNVCTCRPVRKRRWTVYRIDWPELFSGPIWMADPEVGRLDFTHGEDNGSKGFDTFAEAIAYADSQGRALARDIAEVEGKS